MLSYTSVVGQDIHYSQFQNSPTTINPGLTGIFRGDARFSANYRGQWTSVPVGYQTVTAGADAKLAGNEDGFFSGGLNFNYDQAGYSRLNLTNLGLSGSYTHRLSKGTFATFGVAGYMNQRAFETEDLNFGTQYDPRTGQYIAGSETYEDFPEQRNMFGSVGAGFNLRFQKADATQMIDFLDERTRLDVGLGIFHLNTPNQAFNDAQESNLSMRFSPYVIGVFQLSNNLDLVTNLSAQFQKPYMEGVAALGAKLHLDRDPGEQLAIQLSAAVRFDDENENPVYSSPKHFDAFVFPMVEVHYNNWRAGLSYDVNLSDFEVATRGKGGPEVSLQYIIFNPKVKKACLII